MGLALRSEGCQDFPISHNGCIIENIKRSSNPHVVICDICGSNVFNIVKKRFHFTCVKCGLVKKTIGGWFLVPTLELLSA